MFFVLERLSIFHYGNVIKKSAIIIINIYFLLKSR